MIRRRPQALLRVSPEGEPSYKVTVARFLREQSDAVEDLRPEVRKLLAGKIETIVLGGGAQPVAYVTLASAPAPTKRARRRTV